MSDVLENNLPLTAGGDVKAPAELDIDECFAPFVPEVSAALAPKPRPSPQLSFVDNVFSDLGYLSG
jgi:hypothetical protein